MNETKDFETMSRLKFIGRIKKGERIDVGNLTLLRPSLFTSLYRTFINRDNRINALHFIRETVSSAFDMAEYLEANIDSCEANKQMLLVHYRSLPSSDKDAFMVRQVGFPLYAAL